MRRHSDVAPCSGGLTLVNNSIFARDVVPFFIRFALFGFSALAIDALLHWFDAVWIGRYLGIPGVLLIIGSFG